MKSRFWLLGITAVLLLTGCNSINVEPNNDEKINEFTEQAFLLNDMDKTFAPELSKETVKEFVYQMKDENYKLIAIDESYGEITEGLTDDGNGKKVGCYKLPVTFSFRGSEALITDFLDSLKNRNVKVVMNRFEVTEQEEEYAVECIVSFIGQSAKVEVGGISNSLSLVKNSKEEEENEEIVLRDFDAILTVRPSNSDAAAVTLATEAGNSLYSDENAVVDVKTEFYKEGNSYYCKYTLGDKTNTDKITVGNEVKFDILSCKKQLDIDNILVNLTISNSMSKSVSVIVYDDPDERVKITKSGSVEVNRK